MSLSYDERDQFRRALKHLCRAMFSLPGSVDLFIKAVLLAGLLAGLFYGAAFVYGAAFGLPFNSSYPAAFVDTLMMLLGIFFLGIFLMLLFCLEPIPGIFHIVWIGSIAGLYIVINFSDLPWLSPHDGQHLSAALVMAPGLILTEALCGFISDLRWPRTRADLVYPPLASIAIILAHLHSGAATC